MNTASKVKIFLLHYKYTLGGSILAVLILLFTLTFVVEHIARQKIRSKCDDLKTERGVTVRFDDFRMKGFNEFHFKGLSVVPFPGDTLFSIKKLKVRLRLLPLLVLRPNIASVEIDGTKARFVKKEEYCNYDFLFISSSSHKKPDQEMNRRNFAQLFNRLFDLFFRVIPDRLEMSDTELSSFNKGYLTEMAIPQIDLRNHQLQATIIIADSTKYQTWIAEGTLDKSRKTIEGVLHGQTPQDTLSIPYLDKVYDAKIEFQALRFALTVSSSSRKEVLFEGNLSTQGLKINYWRLAPTDIIPDNLSVDYICKVLPMTVEMDSSSTLRFNDIAIHPYLQFRKDKGWGIRCSLNEKDIPAQKLLNSLPQGLFSTLNQIRLEGKFDYHFLFDFNLDSPDELIFEAGVPRNDIRITQFGELSKLNAPFVHTAYVRERPVRTFTVGESNPSYRPLSAISPLLQNAVLQSEDGQFYYHTGFQPDALREALIHDIKVRRFARGGSTVSMQLVKNVFLSRNKNLFRKVEEAAVVWLLENKHITSKARLFEVYLNIIEWGPMIYGAEEAAHFYFAKPAIDLNVQEALFLSSIIPNPALFRYSFDPETGKIKESRTGHFRRVAHRLAKAGLMSEEEAESLIPNVELKGAAKQYFSQPDTTLSDEIIVSEELDLLN